MPDSLSCCLLTPVGRGAIAVVAVFGDGLVEHLSPLFESASGRTLAQAEPNSILYGRWRTTREDVVLTPFADRYEIHCHGGQAAPAAILNSLVAAGFALLPPQVAAANLFGTFWQAELALAMGRATTERTAEFLLRQVALAGEELPSIEQHLKSADPQLRQVAQRSVQAALKHAEFGLHLTQPWSVVLCGRPNVGKSSLINALVGFDRAIVHHEAGTTRDVVTQCTALEGWPVELKDTAGLREAQNEIERQGVALSHAEIESADLVVAVFDATELLATELDWDFVRHNRAKLVVVNKIDRLTPSELASIESAISRQPNLDSWVAETLAVSAITLQGIRPLIAGIANQLIPEPPPQDQLVPVSIKQIDWLESAMVCNG